MKLVTKVFIRRELRQAKRAKNVELIELLQSALDDVDIFELVHEANQAEWDYERERRLFAGEKRGDVFGSGISDFFSFLFENREAIFEMIMTFIQLFAMFASTPEEKE